MPEQVVIPSHHAGTTTAAAGMQVPTSASVGLSAAPELLFASLETRLHAFCIQLMKPGLSEMHQICRDFSEMKRRHFDLHEKVCETQLPALQKTVDAHFVETSTKLELARQRDEDAERRLRAKVDGEVGSLQKQIDALAQKQTVLGKLEQVVKKNFDLEERCGKLEQFAEETEQRLWEELELLRNREKRAEEERKNRENESESDTGGSSNAGDGRSSGFAPSEAESQIDRRDNIFESELAHNHQNKVKRSEDESRSGHDLDLLADKIADLEQKIAALEARVQEKQEEVPAAVDEELLEGRIAAAQQDARRRQEAELAELRRELVDKIAAQSAREREEMGRRVRATTAGLEEKIVSKAYVLSIAEDLREAMLRGGDERHKLLQSQMQNAMESKIANHEKLVEAKIATASAHLRKFSMANVAEALAGAGAGGAAAARQSGVSGGVAVATAGAGETIREGGEGHRHDLHRGGCAVVQDQLQPQTSSTTTTPFFSGGARPAKISSTIQEHISLEVREHGKRLVAHGERLDELGGAVEDLARLASDSWRSGHDRAGMHRRLRNWLRIKRAEEELDAAEEVPNAASGNGATVRTTSGSEGYDVQKRASRYYNFNLNSTTSNHGTVVKEKTELVESLCGLHAADVTTRDPTYRSRSSGDVVGVDLLEEDEQMAQGTLLHHEQPQVRRAAGRGRSHPHRLQSHAQQLPTAPTSTAAKSRKTQRLLSDLLAASSCGPAGSHRRRVTRRKVTLPTSRPSSISPRTSTSAAVAPPLQQQVVEPPFLMLGEQPRAATAPVARSGPPAGWTTAALTQHPQQQMDAVGVQLEDDRRGVKKMNTRGSGSGQGTNKYRSRRARDASLMCTSASTASCTTLGNMRASTSPRMVKQVFDRTCEPVEEGSCSYPSEQIEEAGAPPSALRENDDDNDDDLSFLFEDDSMSISLDLQRIQSVVSPKVVQHLHARGGTPVVDSYPFDELAVGGREMTQALSAAVPVAGNSPRRWSHQQHGRGPRPRPATLSVEILSSPSSSRARTTTKSASGLVSVARGGSESDEHAEDANVGNEKVQVNKSEEGGHNSSPSPRSRARAAGTSQRLVLLEESPRTTGTGKPSSRELVTAGAAALPARPAPPTDSNSTDAVGGRDCASSFSRASRFLRRSSASDTKKSNNIKPQEAEDVLGAARHAFAKVPRTSTLLEVRPSTSYVSSISNYAHINK